MQVDIVNDRQILLIIVIMLFFEIGLIEIMTTFNEELRESYDFRNSVFKKINLVLQRTYSVCKFYPRHTDLKRSLLTDVLVLNTF